MIAGPRETATLPAMYEKKVGRAYLRGCLKSLVVMAVGAVFGVALLATVLFVARGGDIEPRSPRLALALAMPFLFMAVPLAGAVVFVRLRAARLDRAFEPWRLRGRQAGAVMRSWHGEVGGRMLNAWFHRGPTLELYLACRPATRGILHRGGVLIRALSKAVDSRRPMASSPFEAAGVTIVADDEAWMRRLLDRPDARAAVTRLMGEASRVASAVSVSPNAVRYMRRFQPLSGITADNLRSWLADLETLAAAVDALGPSAAGLEPGRLEEWARTSRDRYLTPILLGLGVVFLLVMAALFVFGWLFIGQP